MKMKSGVEQALCIMIMLATQLDKRPLKEHHLKQTFGRIRFLSKKGDAGACRLRSGPFRSRERRRIRIEKDTERNYDAAHL